MENQKNWLSRAWDGITHTMPRFSAKMLIMTAVLGAMIVAGYTLFIWDMDFYARLTPTGQESINYQRVGFALRTMAIAGLPLFLLAREINAPKSALASVIVLWVLSTLLCLVAALGFLSEAQDYHFRKATAVTDTQAAVVLTVDAQLADLDKEAADVKSNRDNLIAGARQSMEYVLNDGVPGNDDLTTFESQIAVYQADAQTQLNMIQASKEALRKQALEATVTGTEETVGDSAIHPVFTMISGAMPGGPTWWRDVFTLVSAVTLELLVAVGFGAWWAIVRHGKVAPVHEGYSADVPEGTVNINMTEAEWKAYEDALAAAENAPPQDPSDLRRIGQEGYWIERIGKALKTRMRNPTAEGMFNTYFSGIGSVHELRAHLSLMLKRGALSQDHFDFITREGKYAPPEQEINGLDQEGANDHDDADDTSANQLPAI